MYMYMYMCMCNVQLYTHKIQVIYKMYISLHTFQAVKGRMQEFGTCLMLPTLYLQTVSASRTYLCAVDKHTGWLWTHDKVYAND